MESMNKFKVLTIVVICMFIFIIGAIYSNTKDATLDKQKIKVDNMGKEIKNDTVEITHTEQATAELSTQIERLNARIDELSQKVGESQGLNCRIIGSMSDNGIEQLSEDAAIQEARVNNKDIVITCSF